MSSDAREALTQLMSARTIGGMFLAPKDGGADGADLPPGSMAYPPCQCPLHRSKPATDHALKSAVREANQRSRRDLVPVPMQQWRDSQKTAGDAAASVQEVLRLLGAPAQVTNAINGVVDRRGNALVQFGAVPADLAEHVAEAVRKGALQ